MHFLDQTERYSKPRHTTHTMIVCGSPPACSRDCTTIFKVNGCSPMTCHAHDASSPCT